MKSVIALSVLISLMLIPSVVRASSDDKIKKEIIAQSIRNYSGNCPCPYNVDRGGRKCGKRSAYSKPGGYSPICYLPDVTARMVTNYKNK